MNHSVYYDIQKEIKSICAPSIKKIIIPMQSAQMDCQSSSETLTNESPENLVKDIEEWQSNFGKSKLNLLKKYQPEEKRKTPIKYSETETDTETLKNSNIIIKSLYKEVRLLRKEVDDLKKLKRINPTPIEIAEKIRIDLPKSTVQDFLILEEELQSNEELEKNLIVILNKLNDKSLKVFINSCMKEIITNEVAVKFSWHGLNNNWPVKDFVIMNIIKETAMKKFPSARVGEIIKIIQKWFNYARDRKRSLNKKKLIKK